MISTIIVWSIFGLLAGLLAKWIMPGKDPGGIFVTILIGIVGAIIGGWLGGLIGFSDGASTDDSLMSVLTNWRLWVTSVLGALLVLFIWKKLIAPNINR